MKRIFARHSYYLIEDVQFIPRSIEYDLSLWNNVCFKREYIGIYYNEDKKELRIPRGYSEVAIKNAFPYHTFIVDKEHLPYDKIDVNLTAPPRDYHQEHTLAFMIGKEPYTFSSAYSQLYVTLDTGSGKTYCGVATTCYYKSRVVVMTPSTNSKIGDQWLDSFSNFTTLRRNEILMVKGSSMCEDIIKGKYEDVKVFIIPRSTILAFVKKYNNDWNILELLVKKMNVGIKIVDEAHMDFNNLVNIICHTNTKRTYYMSSSPSRSQKDEKRIYDKVFKDVPKYGKALKTKEQNHIIPLIMMFKSTPSREQLRAIKTRHGPSAAKYGEYLLDGEGARDEFIEAYTFAIYWLMRLRRNSGKFLVLCITKEFAREMAKITNELFPYLSTGLYIGSGKDKPKELDNDIVFSTIKSMGTGAEIQNHQFTINTITYASDVLADQLSGRLRKFDGRKAIYTELVNINHEVAKGHYDTREPFLKKKAKDGVLLVHNINQSNITEMDKFFSRQDWYDENGMLRTKDGHYKIGKRKK